MSVCMVMGHTARHSVCCTPSALLLLFFPVQLTDWRMLVPGRATTNCRKRCVVEQHAPNTQTIAFNFVRLMFKVGIASQRTSVGALGTKSQKAHRIYRINQPGCPQSSFTATCPKSPEEIEEQLKTRSEINCRFLLSWPFKDASKNENKFILRPSVCLSCHTDS